MENENVRIIKSSSHHSKDEPTEDSVGSIVSVKEMLRDVAMIKQYAIDNDDVETWDCANRIERKLSMLRFGDVQLERTW